MAIVCPACPASFTLPDLGLKTQADLLARGSRQARSAAASLANGGTQRGDTSVAGIAAERWGVRPAPAVARFALPGWEYLRETDVACPECAGLLHGLSRVYEQHGRPRGTYWRGGRPVRLRRASRRAAADLESGLA